MSATTVYVMFSTAENVQSVMLEILKRIQTDVSSVKIDVTSLKADVTSLKTDMSDVKG